MKYFNIYLVSEIFKKILSWMKCFIWNITSKHRKINVGNCHGWLTDWMNEWMMMMMMLNPCAFCLNSGCWGDERSWLLWIDDGEDIDRQWEAGCSLAHIRSTGLRQNTRPAAQGNTHCMQAFSYENTRREKVACGALSRWSIGGPCAVI